MEEYVEILCDELREMVRPAFSNLNRDKKTRVLLSICKEAGNRDNPMTLNIKEVAQGGGFAVGSLYQYFGNRRAMMDFFLAFLRRYMEEIMQVALEALAPLPLAKALEYYCQGAAQWGQEERDMALVFYKGAYCGGTELNERLIAPLGRVFQEGLHRILEGASQRGEIRRDLDLPFWSGWIYRSLIPFSDSEIYRNLEGYFFPDPERKEDLKTMIDQFVMLMVPGGDTP